MPPLSNIVHGGSIPSNIPTSGYISSYGDVMGNVGVSEYGSQNLTRPSYASSDGIQLHHSSSGLIGGGSSGGATPGSSGRSRPPSVEMRGGPK
jgi:hypothetical protein